MAQIDPSHMARSSNGQVVQPTAKIHCSISSWRTYEKWLFPPTQPDYDLSGDGMKARRLGSEPITPSLSTCARTRSPVDLGLICINSISLCRDDDCSGVWCLNVVDWKIGTSANTLWSRVIITGQTALCIFSTKQYTLHILLLDNRGQL